MLKEISTSTDPTEHGYLRKEYLNNYEVEYILKDDIKDKDKDLQNKVLDALCFRIIGAPADNFDKNNKKYEPIFKRYADPTYEDKFLAQILDKYSDDWWDILEKSIKTRKKYKSLEKLPNLKDKLEEMGTIIQEMRTKNTLLEKIMTKQQAKEEFDYDLIKVREDVQYNAKGCINLLISRMEDLNNIKNRRIAEVKDLESEIKK